MSTAEDIKRSQQRIINHDTQDALRIVQAAAVVAALPGIMSRSARDGAAAKLRLMAHDHPDRADVLLAIVNHLEEHP